MKSAGSDCELKKQNKQNKNEKTKTEKQTNKKQKQKKHLIVPRGWVWSVFCKICLGKLIALLWSSTPGCVCVCLSQYKDVV